MTRSLNDDYFTIDNGTSLIKAGFAGYDTPSKEFSSIVGKPKYGHDNVLYVGSEAQSKRGVLKLRHPIENGIITNWDDMERIWSYTFQELGVKSENQAVLLTESPLNPAENRERTAEIMFEKFNVPSMYLISQANLALFASGRTTGCVLESGDGVTCVVPISQGYAISNAIIPFKIAGKQLTDTMVQLISDIGQYFNAPPTTAELEIAREIKEKLCYVAYDFDQTIKIAKGSPDVEKSYELPDGAVVYLNDERVRCPEELFKPSFAGSGVHKCVLEAITKCDASLHNDLYSNIVLSGGSTMFPGFAERMLKELTHLAPGKNIEVVPSPDGKYSAWLGGSFLASLSSFDDRSWISKAEYKESGSINRRAVVHQKCDLYGIPPDDGAKLVSEMNRVSLERNKRFSSLRDSRLPSPENMPVTLPEDKKLPSSVDSQLPYTENKPHSPEDKSLSQVESRSPSDHLPLPTTVDKDLGAQCCNIL